MQLKILNNLIWPSKSILFLISLQKKPVYKEMFLFIWDLFENRGIAHWNKTSPQPS